MYESDRSGFVVACMILQVVNLYFSYALCKVRSPHSATSLRTRLSIFKASQCHMLVSLGASSEDGHAALLALTCKLAR